MKSRIWATTSAKLAAMGAAVALATVASAGEEIHAKYAIAVDEGQGTVAFDLDSATMGFDLHDMQEGESRSIVDESGRNILITRTAEGFTFDIDGKSIEMPMIAGEHGVTLVDGEHATNVDVRVLHDASFEEAEPMEGVMIISSDTIDESTREAIRATLISAGHDGDVEFIDKAGAHGMHKVKVIKRDVEITH